jgi:hypothetical protein
MIRLGDPGIGNFEGFACLNRPCQLPLDSEESEGVKVRACWLLPKELLELKLPPILTQRYLRVRACRLLLKEMLALKLLLTLENLVSVKPIHEIEPTAPNSYWKVIIIEPVAYTLSVDEYFSNDLTVSKALADSSYGRAGIAGFS